MIEPETLDVLARHAASAADGPALAMLMSGGTKAAAVSAGVRAALVQLEEQGFISVTPRIDWPPYFYPDGKPAGFPD